LPGLPAGWFEVAPDAIEAAARAVVGELLWTAPLPAGVFGSGQMGGPILVDADGGALTNYLSWRDQRTLTARSGHAASCLEAIRSRWDAEVLRSLGNELQPGSTTSLLFWLSEAGRLDPRGMPVTVADYVI